MTTSNIQLDLIFTILACLGIIIILFSIGSYVFEYGAKIKDYVQQFEGFGLKLSVSVITVFILTGVALIIPLIWSNFNNTIDSLNKKDKDLQSQIDQLSKQKEYISMQLNTINSNKVKAQTLFLELEGTSKSDFPNDKDLQVGYYNDSDSSAQRISDYQIVNLDQKRIRITMDNITDNTEYPKLEVVQLSKRVKWVFENFKPTKPVITLKKEKE